MTATLGSRLILNLRGSVLRPAYNEDHAALEMNLLSFNGEAGDQTALARIRKVQPDGERVS
jgi:hypothetical protein